MLAGVYSACPVLLFVATAALAQSPPAVSGGAATPVGAASSSAEATTAPPVSSGEAAGPTPTSVPQPAAEQRLSALPTPVPKSGAAGPNLTVTQRQRDRGYKLLTTGIVFTLIGLGLVGGGVGMLNNPTRTCHASLTGGYSCGSSYGGSLSGVLSSIPFTLGAAHLLVGVPLMAVGGLALRPLSGMD